ncbi:MAG TPA: EAL domain-containing protein [Rhodanobacteraceae bacterium]|nr:EAL domain-containing protein [Rhodanobacteraceae bacterium]
MNKDNVVRILFVQDKAEDIEQVISILRNGGIAVRPSGLETADDLPQVIEEHAPDLVLADPTASIPADAVMRAVEASGKDIAVVALARDTDDDLITEIFALGMRGLALASRPAQLQQIVRREFEALSMRRNVRELEAALRESERRCDSLLDSSRDPIAYVHEGMYVRANQAYLEMFGLGSFEEIEGLTLLDMVAPEDAPDFKALLQRLVRGEKPPEKLELHARHSDGSSFPAVMQFASATFEGEPCLQIIFRHQEVAVEVSREMEELRWRDAVTGLFNRGHLLERIGGAVAEAAKGRKNQALLLVEPDAFRATVDAIGLSGVDPLLHDLATVIAAQLSEFDVAGRIAEHTFAVLLLDRDQAAVAASAERLRKAVEEHIFDTGARSLSMTASIGGSLLNEKNASSSTLLDQATERLRAVQGEGGNRCDIFNPSAQEQAEAERERRWLAMIERALDDDGFVLFYQQIVSLQGAEGEYYEILLRMQGPKGEIMPNLFLPIAERHGLLPRIDRWVLGRAIALLAERARDPQPTIFMVKLTPQSLDDVELADWIGTQLKKAGISGKSLVLEMPESKVLTNLKPARQFVDRIKELGCAFALEQFGSGLNSFQLLKHIPADYLKIDRSFLAELPKHPENQDRVREICNEAKRQGQMTVAEWVQDAASTSILFSCGVQFVQGNFLQEPEKVVSYEATG